MDCTVCISLVSADGAFWLEVVVDLWFDVVDEVGGVVVLSVGEDGWFVCEVGQDCIICTR